MFWQRTEHSLLSTRFIYLFEVLAGVQIALYFFDCFDDGVELPLSGWIGAGFLAGGVAIVLWPFVRARRSQLA